MEIQASRAAARVGPSGEPVLLLDQNRARWDELLIRPVLRRLSVPRGSAARSVPTRCRRRLRHVTREHACGGANWARIAAL